MSKRTKKPALEIPQTKEEVLALIADTAEHRRSKQRLQTLFNSIVDRFKARYAPEIEGFDALIATNLGKLELWCTAHKTNEFGSRRSVKMGGHDIGWRTGNHETRLSKGRKWEDVLKDLEGLKALGEAEDADEVTATTAAAADLLIRVKKEADKQAMIDRREDPVVKAILEKVGVLVSQGETFFLALAEEPVTAGAMTTKEG